MNSSFRYFVQSLKYKINRKYSAIASIVLFVMATVTIVASHSLFLENSYGRVIAATFPNHQISYNITSEPVALTEVCDASALSKGNLKCNAKAVVEVLGTNYACNERVNWFVKTNFQVGSQGFLLTEGQRLAMNMNGKNNAVITSIPINSGAKCSNSSKTLATNSRNIFNSRVRLLTDGSDVPDLMAFKEQNSVAPYLQKYLDRGKIKLADNEAIYLFELGQKNANKPGFDLQDNAIKISLYKPE
jgi:hypothetical protein